MPAFQPSPDIPRADDVRTPTFRTKQELVYHTLREEILACTLQPEQRLVIEDIARRLHVSTIPVREALQLLQSEGLVETTPHVGAMVAPLSRESIVDVFSVLEGLQMVAGRLAAVRGDDGALARLADYVKAMDEAVNRNQFDAWADLNTRFHVAISDVPGLPLLRQTNAQALDRWDRIRRYFYDGVLSHRVPQAQREHHDLLHALTSRDAGAVGVVTRQHYRAAMAAYLDYFDGRENRNEE
jgi:DNA-binding GntR family transcriptional regulator